MTPYFEQDGVTLYHGDCREILPGLGQQFQTVLTDPPYGKVRGDFDQAWTNRRAMLADVTQWRDAIVDRMTANATLWWFAWPSLAGMIEAHIAERLNPLAHVVWKKPTSLAQKHSPEILRAPGPETERILMFEQYGADSWALGGTGYAHECEKVRGMVFEPLRAYLIAECKRAGRDWNAADIIKVFKDVTPCKTEESAKVVAMHKLHPEYTQWQMPTQRQYDGLRKLFGSDFLRREYEDLRREYEDLRRYFALKTGQPKTDIWEFPTATTDERLGHPTPKPLALIRFMIDISVRPQTAILDPFAGSGTTLLAARLEGRQAVGIEISERYCEIAANRLRQKFLF